MILKLLVLVGIPLVFYFIFGKKSLFVIIGLVLGVFLAKTILFTEVELIGWEYFWDSLNHGHIDKNDIKEIVLKSTTFHKSVLGAVLGGWIGSYVGDIVFGKKKKG